MAAAYPHIWSLALVKCVIAAEYLFCLFASIPNTHCAVEFSD